jgi:SAM-dependent methyltransferase
MVSSDPKRRDAERSADAARSEYVLTKDWAGEHERLQLLEATFDPLSMDAIRAAGIKHGSRCLEIGAGAGSIARWCAEQVGDPSLVCATDMDTRLLTALAADGLTVLQHDVLVDDFPPGSFDIVHARAVLEHIPAREVALDRIVDWLAPDGALVLGNFASFPVFSSPHEAHRDAMRALFEVLAITGTDFDWGRTFPEPLRRRGYRDVGVSAIVPVLQGGSPHARFLSLTLESLRQRIVEAGLLSDLALNEAQRLLADPEFWDLAPAFIAAWGRRPA